MTELGRPRRQARTLVAAALRAPAWALAALGLALALAPAANATVVFTPGNNPQPGEENILNLTLAGNTVTGQTKKTGSIVQFTSSTDQLVVQGGGQSHIDAQDGRLNDLTITVPGGVSFLDFILNPAQTGPHHPTNATAEVVVTDNLGGTFTFSPYALGSGNNFLTMVAQAGEMITSIKITSAVGFTQFQQPRISGVGGTTAVPEPGTMALLGASLVGLGLVLRRRKGPDGVGPAAAAAASAPRAPRPSFGRRPPGRRSRLPPTDRIFRNPR